jgi:fused signal recognition particle receptor
MNNAFSMSDSTSPSGRKQSGFFSSVKRGLFMTHTEILEKLGTAVKKGLGFDESVLESLEEALIAADVGAETAGALTAAVRARSGGAERTDLEGLRRLLTEEIERLITEAPRPAASPDAPLEVIFLVGVNGSGKTTTAAKLAARRLEEGRSVLLAAADTFRAGAIEQLAIWADRLKVPVVRHREGADPSAVLFDAIAAAKARGVRTLLVDTAGRLHTKQNLMEELAKMRRIAAREVPGAPHQTLLVLEATTGSNGLAQARRFVEAAGATGVVLTKLDGSAKGGIVLAIYREPGCPCSSESGRTDDLIPFEPPITRAPLGWTGLENAIGDW